MTRLFLIATMALGLAAGQAAAACTVEYKAKKDDPLRLEQSTMTIPDTACTKEAAAPIVAAELKKRGWILLSIVSVSGE